MLDRFIQSQLPGIARLESLEKAGMLPEPYTGPRPGFSFHIRQKNAPAVIAEYKRASPSRGDINLAAGPAEIAAAYAGAGAAALSVLTEKEHFKGDTAFIEQVRFTGLPILRKDFLIHPLQIRESAATAASTVLLIARILDENTFAAMLRAAEEAGLEAVLEIFDAEDLAKTRRVLARVPMRRTIIQVNNRDLQKLTVSFRPSRELIGHKRDDEIWISASGVSSPEHMEELARFGFDAVLVGSFLMGESSPGAALARLTGQAGVKI